MPETPPVLQILGIQNTRPTFQSGGNDEAIVKAVLGFPVDPKSRLI